MANGRGATRPAYDLKTGKRIIKNVLGKTQAEVKRKLSAAMETCKAGDIVRSDDYTMVECPQTWYALYTKPNIRPTKTRSYQGNIELHIIPQIGEQTHRPGHPETL